MRYQPLSNVQLLFLTAKYSVTPAPCLCPSACRALNVQIKAREQPQGPGPAPSIPDEELKRAASMLGKPPGAPGGPPAPAASTAGSAFNRPELAAAALGQGGAAPGEIQPQGTDSDWDSLFGGPSIKVWGQRFGDGVWKNAGPGFATETLTHTMPYGQRRWKES